MSAITNTLSKVVNSVGSALGMGPSMNTSGAAQLSNALTGTAPAAPQPYTSAADAAQQQAAAGASRGTATTLLTSTSGVDKDKLQTSKVLLGQ